LLVFAINATLPTDSAKFTALKQISNAMSKNSFVLKILAVFRYSSILNSASLLLLIIEIYL